MIERSEFHERHAFMVRSDSIVECILLSVPFILIGTLGRLILLLKEVCQSFPIADPLGQLQPAIVTRVESHSNRVRSIAHSLELAWDFENGALGDPFTLGVIIGVLPIVELELDEAFGDLAFFCHIYFKN